MKKVLAVLMIVGMSLSSAVTAAVANSNTAAPAVEQKQAVKPQLFTGVVLATENGIALETRDGIIPLKGLDLKPMVNQEVIINGIAKTEKGSNVIYVVKATVKS